MWVPSISWGQSSKFKNLQQSQASLENLMKENCLQVLWRVCARECVFTVSHMGTLGTFIEKSIPKLPTKVKHCKFLKAPPKILYLFISDFLLRLSSFSKQFCLASITAVKMVFLTSLREPLVSKFDLWLTVTLSYSLQGSSFNKEYFGPNKKNLDDRQAFFQYEPKQTTKINTVPSLRKRVLRHCKFALVQN